MNCLKEVIPSQVLRRTEAISRAMQNLLITLKEGKHENMINCSKKIIGAVRDLTLLFPEVHSSLKFSTLCHILFRTQDTRLFRSIFQHWEQQLTNTEFSSCRASSQTPTTEVPHPWSCWSAPSTSPSQLANSRSTSDDSFTTNKSVIPLFILHAFTYFYTRLCCCNKVSK